MKLKNADNKTSEKIFEISPPDWDMDGIFETSYRKYRSSGESGDVIDEPLEVVGRKNKRSFAAVAFIASAVSAAALIIAVTPMLFPKNPDQINDERPVIPIATQATKDNSTSATTSTAISSSNSKTTMNSTKTSTTGMTTETEISAVKTDAAVTGQVTAPVTEPPEVPTEPQTEPPAPTEPETETNPHEYEKLPAPNAYDSQEDYYREVAKGIAENRYFCDFNGDGQFDFLDTGVIMAFYLDSTVHNSHDPEVLKPYWNDRHEYNEYNLSDVLDIYQDHEYLLDEYDPTIVFIYEIYTIETLENVVKYGDISGDGIITSKDASILMSILENYSD